MIISRRRRRRHHHHHRRRRRLLYARRSDERLWPGLAGLGRPPPPRVPMAAKAAEEGTTDEATADAAAAAAARAVSRRQGRRARHCRPGPRALAAANAAPPAAEDPHGRRPSPSPLRAHAIAAPPRGETGQRQARAATAAAPRSASSPGRRCLLYWRPGTAPLLRDVPGLPHCQTARRRGRMPRRAAAGPATTMAPNGLAATESPQVRPPPAWPWIRRLKAEEEAAAARQEQASRTYPRPIAVEAAGAVPADRAPG